MTGDPLFGVKSKIGRATEQLQSLAVEIASFNEELRQGAGYDVVFEGEDHSGQETKEVHVLRILRPVPDVRWGITVGVVVHLCRSALDNLMELLTTSYSMASYFDSQFPIFDDRGRYHLLTKKGLPHPRSGLYQTSRIDPAAAVIVEAVQPYHSAGPLVQPTSHALWVLHELWNMDKHRVAPIVGMSGFIERFTPSPSFHGKSLEVEVTFPFEDGTRVAWAHPASDPPMKVELKLAIEPTFDGGPAQGRSVVDALQRIIRVTAAVASDLAPYVKT